MVVGWWWCGASGVVLVVRRGGASSSTLSSTTTSTSTSTYLQCHLARLLENRPFVKVGVAPEENLATVALKDALDAYTPGTDLEDR